MRYVWLVIFLCSAMFALGQNSSRVRQLEQQRKEAQAEIELTNKLLNETTSTAQNSLNRLNLLTQQLANRKRVIDLLNQEVTSIDRQLVSMQNEINRLERELKEKKDSYAKSVRTLGMKRTSQDKLLFILSADGFMQSMRRMRYLREFAAWQKKQAGEIIEKQKEIEAKKQALEKTKAEKQSLLKTREEERKKLQAEEAGQRTEVQNLNRRRQQLQADLRKKRQQAAALDREIERQIAAEIARAAEAARIAAARENASTKPADARVANEKGGYAMTQAERQLSGSFEQNRGKLPPPVTARYTIVAGFGEQQHQQLRYVRTNNSGIDLQTSSGAEAQAVFNGEVTRVFVVPGYNNSVIIRHGNYLTVYSNLSEVYVKQGDKVTTSQRIGKVYSDARDGNSTILHFQLWREKTKLNPAPWITR